MIIDIWNHIYIKKIRDKNIKNTSSYFGPVYKKNDNLMRALLAFMPEYPFMDRELGSFVPFERLACYAPGGGSSNLQRGECCYSWQVKQGESVVFGKE
jgi:hypothetical protein